jgi:GntR family transcriptional regulator
MQIHLSVGDGVAIYRQIVTQVKRLVAAGRLAPGEALPPIRTLAERLRINPNTVARAYSVLEHEGVVLTRKTAGTFVSGGGSPLAREECLRRLTDRADVLLAEARQMNVGLDEVLALIRRRHDEMTRGGGEE